MNFKVTRLKEFTSGIFKDMTIEEVIKARSLEEAQKLAMLKEVKNPIGSSPYKIIWSHISVE